MLRMLVTAVAISIFPLSVSAFDLSVTGVGLSDDTKQDLTAASLVAGLKTSDDPATGQDILAAAQADYTRLVGVFYENGYFAPVISIRINGQEASEIPAFAPPPNVSRVEIAMQSGPIFSFAQAHITPIARGTELPETFAQNQTATTGAIRKAVDAGISGWRNAGHAKAALASQQITAQHARNEINADLRISPGPRLRFGDIIPKGHAAMRVERIIDIAGLPTGKVFDPKEVQRAATRLRRTGVFSSVALSEAEMANADGSIDITAQLAEAKPRRFGVGAELSTQEGLSLSGFWLHRNLLGGGERLRIDAAIEGIEGSTGGEDYELGFTFGRPATFNEDTDFYLMGRLASRNEANFSSKRATLEAGIRRYASDEREYTFGIGLDAADTVDAFGENSYRVLTFPLGAEFDYRDNEFNAKDGYYLNASLTPFVGISGTKSGLRSYLDARAYRSTGRDDRLTFALRGQLGSVIGPALSNAPTDFLFYSGGGGTVRGHDYQALGVTQPNGAVSGGRSFLALSGEVRVETTDRLSLVGFIDAGYIGTEEFPDASSGEWHTGAGAGIRYDTGIGPVRLDVAVPVSGPGNPSGFQLYIGIGQAF